MLADKCLLLIVLLSNATWLVAAQPLLPHLDETSSRAVEQAGQPSHFPPINAPSYHSHTSGSVPRLLHRWMNRVMKQLDRLNSRQSLNPGPLPVNVFRQEERLRLDPSADLMVDVTSAARQHEQPGISQALFSPEQQFSQSSSHGRAYMIPLPRERPN